MPSTYTLNNAIEIIATGEQTATWGDTTNTNLQLIDAALDGQVTVTLSSAGSSGSPNNLPITDGAASNGRNRMITFTDGSDLGATAFVQLTPSDAEKIIYVRNSLRGSRSIIMFQGTYNASNDYAIPAGTTAVIYFDGAGSGAVAANLFNNAHFDAMNVLGNATVGGNLGVGGILAVTTGVTSPNIETTNLKAADGTTAGSIANSSGIVTLASSVLTTADINGGTIDGTVIGGTTAAAVTGTTITGTSFASTGDMTFGDNDKAIFGAGSDLEIYHDGSNSIIKDNGAGGLVLRGSTYVALQGANAENGVIVREDGEVDLRYNNITKLATTNTGVDITGTLTSDGLTTSTSGTSNFRAGVNAGNSIQAGGNYNVVVGDEAGTAITTGDNNSLFGFNAGSAISTASGNTLIGTQSGDALTEGDLNVAVGDNTLGSATKSDRNVAIGTYALFALNTTSKTDTYNVAVGFNAGVGVLTGIENTFIGSLSGGAVTTGSKNTIIGAYSGNQGGLDIRTSSNSIVLSDGDGNPRVHVDSSGDVGIGTTAPRAKLEVFDSAVSGVFDAGNLATWRVAQLRNTISSNSGSAAGIAFGGASGDTETAGVVGISDNTTGGVNSLAFVTSAGNNSFERMRIDSSGNAIVGATTANDANAVTLNEDGEVRAAGFYFTNNISSAMSTDGIRRATTGTLAFDTGSTERMRIDSGGNLLVGTTELNLHTTSTVTGSRIGDGFAMFARDGDPLYINRLSDGNIISLRVDGAPVGGIGADSGDLRIYTTAASHVGLSFGNTRIQPTDNTGTVADDFCDIGVSSSRFKDLYLSGGAYLGGTVAANKLDDYEEGTFTPTLPNGATYTSQIGKYTKVGDLVHIELQLAWSANVSDSDMYIAGLPFAPVSVPTFSVFNNGCSAFGSSKINAETSGTNLYLRISDNTTGVSSPATLGTNDATAALRISGTYKT